MQETISTMELRHKLGEILNRVSLLQEQYIIERKGKPIAAIIPLEQLARIQKDLRKSAAQVLHSMGSDISDEEAMKIANEEKKKARSHRK